MEGWLQDNKEEFQREKWEESEGKQNLKTYGPETAINSDCSGHPLASSGMLQIKSEMELGLGTDQDEMGSCESLSVAVEKSRSSVTP